MEDLGLGGYSIGGDFEGFSDPQGYGDMMTGFVRYGIVSAQPEDDVDIFTPLESRSGGEGFAEPEHADVEETKKKPKKAGKKSAKKGSGKVPVDESGHVPLAVLADVGQKIANLNSYPDMCFIIPSPQDRESYSKGTSWMSVDELKGVMSAIEKKQEVKFPFVADYYANMFWAKRETLRGRTPDTNRLPYLYSHVPLFDSGYGHFPRRDSGVPDKFGTTAPLDRLGRQTIRLYELEDEQIYSVDSMGKLTIDDPEGKLHEKSVTQNLNLWLDDIFDLESLIQYKIHRLRCDESDPIVRRHRLGIQNLQSLIFRTLSEPRNLQLIEENTDKTDVMIVLLKSLQALKNVDHLMFITKIIFKAFWKVVHKASSLVDTVPSSIPSYPQKASEQNVVSFLSVLASKVSSLCNASKSSRREQDHIEDTSSILVSNLAPEDLSFICRNITDNEFAKQFTQVFFDAVVAILDSAESSTLDILKSLGEITSTLPEGMNPTTYFDSGRIWKILHVVWTRSVDVKYGKVDRKEAKESIKAVVARLFREKALTSVQNESCTEIYKILKSDS